MSFSLLRSLFGPATRKPGNARSRTTRLEVEALEQREVMSAVPGSTTPLSWTAPSAVNDVVFVEIRGVVELFDNGAYMTSKLLASTSDVVINAAPGVANKLTIENTLVGLPTTINLRNSADVVNVASCSDYLQNIQGILRINGVGVSNGLQVSDASDSATRTGTISATSISGFGGANINYSNLGWVSVSSGTGRNSQYTICGSPGSVDFIDGGASDVVSVSSTSGEVIAMAGAGDSVRLDGPSRGASKFEGQPTFSELTGSGYDNQAFNFSTVKAVSHSTADSATVEGAKSGINNFIGAPSSCLLESVTGGVGGGSYAITVSSFASVTANSHSLLDSAQLVGASTGVNIFNARVDSDLPTATSFANLAGTGYTIFTNNFGKVQATSKSFQDVATLTEASPGHFTLPGMPRAELAEGRFAIDEFGFGRVQFAIL